jgi:DNA-binding LacI/PurR family transcriptional regulator
VKVRRYGLLAGQQRRFELRRGTPALTTVRTDYERLGRRAVTRLLAVLSGQPDPEDPEPISEIIWCESTGPAPA